MTPACPTVGRCQHLFRGNRAFFERKAFPRLDGVRRVRPFSADLHRPRHVLGASPRAKMLHHRGNYLGRHFDLAHAPHRGVSSHCVKCKNRRPKRFVLPHGRASGNQTPCLVKTPLRRHSQPNPTHDTRNGNAPLVTRESSPCPKAISTAYARSYAARSQSQ